MFRAYQLLAASLLFIASTTFARETAVFSRQTVKVNEITLHYEFADATSAAKEQEFTQLIDAGISHFKQMFNGYPRDLSGNSYTDITVRIRHGKHLSGEADPKLLLLTWSDTPLFGVHSWQTLLLHEIFHLWNAESFRYQDGREHWFNEGFSEFYTFQAATQLGIVAGRDALWIAAQPLGFYHSAQSLQKLSMRTAGATNQAKFDNYFLVYHGGWVAAMVLDQDIRRRTDNKHSLDDAMRWLYQYFNRAEKLYKLEDIVAAIKQTSGLDYQSFFASYIDGTSIIPVAEYFDLGKALWDYEFNSKYQHKHRYLYFSLGVWPEFPESR